MIKPASSTFVRESRDGDVIALTLSHPETLNRLVTEEQFLEIASIRRRWNKNLTVFFQ